MIFTKIEEREGEGEEEIRGGNKGEKIVNDRATERKRKREIE